MPKFRKKPVVIEAEQWFPGTPVDGVIEGRTGQYNGEQTTYFDAFVNTLEGVHGVTPGDWIITGVKGEKYPCKPDIFAMTYDPVEID